MHSWWAPSHRDVKGTLRGMGTRMTSRALQDRRQHPNNLLPLSKRRRVAEGDELGLGP